MPILYSTKQISQKNRLGLKFSFRHENRIIRKAGWVPIAESDRLPPVKKRIVIQHCSPASCLLGYGAHKEPFKR